MLPNGAQGISYIFDSGTFNLEIDAQGLWAIKLVSIDDQNGDDQNGDDQDSGVFLFTCGENVPFSVRSEIPPPSGEETNAEFPRPHGVHKLSVVVLTRPRVIKRIN